jgi:hypothetical protein
MHAVVLSLVTLMGAAASPTRSPTPRGPSDPCGSILSIGLRREVAVWRQRRNHISDGLAGAFRGSRSVRRPNAANVPQSYFAFVPSFVASASLPGPSEFYVEHTYFSRAGAGLGAKSLIDTAFLRDFGNSVQLDVEYGFSLTCLTGSGSRTWAPAPHLCSKIGSHRLLSPWPSSSRDDRRAPL